MLRTETEQAAVLGVCVDQPTLGFESEGLNYCSADSTHEAIEMLRLLKFDLVLINAKTPDGPAWGFIRKMRAAFPWQKWALVGEDISDEQEVAARSLGALRVFDVAPSADELAETTLRLRRRSAPTMPRRNLFGGRFKNQVA